MIPSTKIILCSASPRRQQLLHELEIDFETLIKNADETFPSHLKAENIAVFLAEKKAEAFKPDFRSGKIYITADTIVWLNDEVLGKPADADDGTKMLKKLSGNVHCDLGFLSQAGH